MTFVSRIGFLLFLVTGSGAWAAPQSVPGSLAASSMETKTGGGAYSDADGPVYNIWSTGSVANVFQFPSNGSYTFTIAAKGSVAQGTWPNMQVTLDGKVLKNFAVSKTSLASYTFSQDVSGGAHTLKIAFTNDTKVGSEDRNLILSQVAIEGPSGGSTAAPSAPATSSTSSNPAQSTSGVWLKVPMALSAAELPVKNGGGAYNDGQAQVYNIWSPGLVSGNFQFPAKGMYQLNVTAYGTLANGAGPAMEVRIDGRAVRTIQVNSTSAQVYSHNFSVGSGFHTVALAFTNDLNTGSEDRNLIIRTVSIAQAGTTAPSTPSTPAQPPSQTPTPTNPSPNGWSLGQVPFSGSSSFNTPVPAGARYTRVNWPSATGWNYTVNWDHYSPAVYRSYSSDPLVAVSVPASWGWPSGTVNIHIPRGVSGAVGTDGELVIIDGTKVYSFWRFVRFNDTQATVESYAYTDVVTGTGWGTKSPFRGAGITAAGASVLAGLLVQAETDKGEINHALHMAVDANLNIPGAVGEAISSDGTSYGGISHEGDRFAIPPGVAMPSGLSPLGQKVFRAFQKYGCFNVDKAGGTTILRAQANAYNAATMDALRVDLNKIMPLLQKVSY